MGSMTPGVLHVCVALSVCLRSPMAGGRGWTSAASVRGGASQPCPRSRDSAAAREELVFFDTRRVRCACQGGAFAPIAITNARRRRLYLQRSPALSEAFVVGRSPSGGAVLPERWLTRRHGQMPCRCRGGVPPPAERFGGGGKTPLPSPSNVRNR